MEPGRKLGSGQGEGRDEEKEQSRGLKRVREGGMQRERRNWRWVRHQNTVGLGLRVGLVLPALTPNALSLPGAHELVRMDR